MDAGLSGIELERRMDQAGLSPDRLKAILVSHEHTDHIKGAGIMARRLNLPLYLNQSTLNACGKRLGKCEKKEMTTGQKFSQGPFEIHPFSISHDAADPVGFTISSNGRRLGLATDLGVATKLVKVHLADCDALILESNHDRRMLIEGPYPWDLKTRVQGRQGHLSNEDCGMLLSELAHEDLKNVVLAHLSEVNNLPELALKQAKSARADFLSKTKAGAFDVNVAGQHKPTELFHLP